MNLAVNDVSKFYQKKVLDDIKFEMESGVYALLGPNGAGKSTLIRIICGIEEASAGTITYDGQTIQKMDAQYRQKLGYVPQNTGMYENFTAWEFLEYMAVMKGVAKKEVKDRVEKTLGVVNLLEVKNNKIKTFSGGMKQRVNIAQALLNEPEILILDEPTVGLDVNERIKFKQFVSEYAREKIVIFATHIVSDIEDIGSKIVIMKNGRIVANDTTENLLKEVEGKIWEIKCSKDELAVLKKKGKVSNTKVAGEGIILRLIADEKPCDNAKNVDGNLQDMYLLLFS